MVNDAEQRREALRIRNEMTGPVFKMKNDPRVTPIGSFLRRMSLDELPQFWNVLKGDMSLVGPRPPLLSEVKEYRGWQRRRLSMKPGITCIWQVSGRNKIRDFDEWTKMDLEYIDNWSLWLDLKILLKTILAVLFEKGAE
jgi:lipopolysaccharide/colanic/teichoic acid biosynthesis glycosyltransferase